VTLTQTTDFAIFGFLDTVIISNSVTVEIVDDAERSTSFTPLNCCQQPDDISISPNVFDILLLLTSY